MDLYDLVSSTKELLSNLIKRCTEVSDLYLVLKYEIANQRLSYLTEDFSVLLDVIVVLTQHYADIDLNDFQEKLNSIFDALEAEDYLLIADLLKFELRPLLESWEESLVNA